MLASPGRHYGVRINLFVREKTFRLDRDQLVVINADGASESLRYAEVGRLRLYRVNAGHHGMMGRCLVGGRRRTFLLQSGHFVGIARIEDRGATYRPFVRDLIREVSTANPSAIFLIGLPFGSWVVWVAVLVLLVFVFVACMLLLIIGQWNSGLVLASSLAGAPMAWTMVRDRRSRQSKAQDLLQDPTLRDGSA